MIISYFAKYFNINKSEKCTFEETGGKISGKEKGLAYGVH